MAGAASPPGSRKLLLPEAEAAGEVVENREALEKGVVQVMEAVVGKDAKREEYSSIDEMEKLCDEIAEETSTADLDKVLAMNNLATKTTKRKAQKVRALIEYLAE